ncbi:helix-turn-helix domain-containing protein [Kitasatospora sp. NPDC087861]|uniref:helix-turn-helix domain-containing protein n=1 Tax=Kitasatospora sp. NPDC087861 TaxID=3364070 RepID=UPI0038173B4F
MITKNVRCRSCGSMFPRPSNRGRTPQYCGDDCRRRGVSTNRRDKRMGKVVTTRAANAAAIAHSLIDHAVWIERLARMQSPLKALEEITHLKNEIDDFTAYTVRQCRDQNHTWEEIGAALHMTPKTAGRRFTEEYLRRRRRSRGLRARSSFSGLHQALEGRLAAIFQHPAALEDAPAVEAAQENDGAPADDDGTAPTDDGSPPGRPGGRPDPAQLSRALSHLQRCSGATLKALARSAGVSPSYISRVLSGEKMPSWPVTKAMTDACGGKPTDLRILWETARGARPQPPLIRHSTCSLIADAEATLRSTLRGLHLAAFSPPPAKICEQADGPLSPSDVKGLLEDTTSRPVPDWTVVEKVVDALNANEDVVRPLWEHVQVARDPYWTPENGCSTLAAAFG